jgi:hypothetical protein
MARAPPVQTPVDHPDKRSNYPGMAERWLTYQQTGDLLGISAEAARQRARRLKWRSQPGNEGRTLVLVPDNAEASLRVRLPVQPAVRPGVQLLPRTGVQTPDQPAVQTGEQKALADLLREQLEHERGRADRAEALAVASQALAEQRAKDLAIMAERVGRAEGELEGLKLGTEHQHAELAQMRREVAEAHNRGVVAEQQVIMANEQREGAEVALAKARKWNFLNFLFDRAGRSRS